MFYPIIMAGGSGSRLWPLSRKKTPKQLLKFFGKKTLLQETYDRVNELYSDKNIFITTGSDFVDDIKKQVKLPKEIQYIVEPCRKDTAAAIGLLAMILHHHDKNSSVIIVASDHYIKDKKEFQRVVKMAEKLIAKHPQSLLTIGISPTYPEIGYGYIEMGAPVDRVEKDIIFQVSAFKEKPNKPTAQKFVDSWQYLWNAGIFIFRTDYMLSCYKKHMPKTYKILKDLEKYIGTNAFETMLKKEYPKCEKEAFDIAIVEKLKDILVIPASFGWSDIGNWKALKDIASERDDNYKVGESYDLDSQGCLIYNSSAKKIITTIGLKDIVIIDTDDALLVADKERAQEVKKLQDKLKDKFL